MVYWKQKAPKSIRLPDELERPSQRLAKKAGLSWHGWVIGLIQKSIQDDKSNRIKMINDKQDQERCV